MKGVFLDAASLDDLSLEPLASQFAAFTVYGTTEADQVMDRADQAEVVIVNKVCLHDSLLRRLPSLRLICLVATGTDNVALQAARQLGITVCNCQGYGTASVVQHVFALLLALQTNLTAYARDVRAGLWSRSSQFCLLGHPIRELQDKTLGIVGYGTLGQAVAQVAQAFGMQVLLAARPGRTAPGRLPLTELLPRVDVLSLHCPLTEETHNLIDARALALMRPDSILLNTARGGLVDGQALIEALHNRQIRGAGLDVLDLEPPPPDHPLLTTDLPNLIITPHVAWASDEARQRIIEQTAENIRHFLAGTPLRKVN